VTDNEKAFEWTRYFQICPRLTTLAAVQRNDGEKVLQLTLQKLGLVSALDVVKACKKDAEW
jgi:hypothetical protein